MPSFGIGTYQLRTQEAVDIALSEAFKNAELNKENEELKAKLKSYQNYFKNRFNKGVSQ